MRKFLTVSSKRLNLAPAAIHTHLLQFLGRNGGVIDITHLETRWRKELVPKDFDLFAMSDENRRRWFNGIIDPYKHQKCNHMVFNFMGVSGDEMPMETMALAAQAMINLPKAELVILCAPEGPTHNFLRELTEATYNVQPMFLNMREYQDSLITKRAA